MTSTCENPECNNEIMFGNIFGIAFCSDKCKEEMFVRFPNYHKRHEQGHCSYCGNEIKYSGEREEEWQQLHDNGQATPMKMIIKVYFCQPCNKWGQDGWY